MTSRNKKKLSTEENYTCSNQVIDNTNGKEEDLCMHKIYKCIRCKKMFCSNSNQYHDALIFDKNDNNDNNDKDENDNQDIIICVECMIKVSIDKYGNYRERDINFWMYYYSFIPKFLRNHINSITDMIEENLFNCLDNKKEKRC